MQLDESSPLPLYRQIYDSIRTGIDAGSYPPGNRLPSIRGLADELQCSRNTIDAAYSLLVEEGFVASRPGSGYRVLDLHQLSPVPAPAAAGHTSPAAPAGANPVRYDFSYGNLEPGTFPASAWRSIVDDLLLSVESRTCDTYTNPLGEMALRQQIAWRLNSSRNMDCTADQIIVQAGTAASIQNLLALFDSGRDTVCMEEPGYDGARQVFSRSAFPVAPCRVYGTMENFFEDLEKAQPRLLYVTPSSQFPTCSVMPIKMRARLIAWAEANDTYILEDDYCRDFRYRERPLPPLQSMDQSGRVIYMGTFSKSLSPALRMNYLVLPPRLLERWHEKFRGAYPTVPWLSQAACARFMADGQWDRHLRRLQMKNLRKYTALFEALQKAMGQKVDVLENGTGLHLLVDVKDGRSQEELLALARAAGVAVYGTERYWMSENHPLKSCMLVGFSAIREEDIAPGIDALAQAWFG
ncbi:PLP-dependent aminotransferase family protein [Parvibacter caecicola]|uniref:MocR-like pyridoxine biosynthesis transcription factor PdxR n=1 Tax=Parvibacter caecicola TaxID=747645 RepID=UPI0023F330BE|nr:PLP-dependent aminotransferase family protein [Parvibacter caecicola]